MNQTLEGVLIVSSFLLFISVLISKVSAKTGIPTLLLFLGIGMLAGSDGVGGIVFENYKMAQAVGTITIMLILFFGGFDTDIRHIKHLIFSSTVLSTLGVLVTSVSIGYFIHLITDFSFVEGLLVGAIISSTDAAAVFATLRAKKISLKNNLAAILELESGSNDVVSYFIMILCIGIINKQENLTLPYAVFMFLREMILGGIIGFLLGKGLVFVINRANLVHESLYPGLPLSAIIFGYSVTTYFHGSGFLCVYIAAIVMGSSNLLHKESLKKFYEAITWMLEIVVFLILGLLVFPKHLVPVSFMAITIALVLMFVARPLGVFISLSFFKKIDFKQKIFVSWGGLRGAAPIIFAIYPFLYGLENADKIFHIVFFIVITSVILQGTTLSKLAKWLHLEATETLPTDVSHIETEEKSELVELSISVESEVIGMKIVELGLPKGVIIVTIQRDESYLTPRGDTVLEARDKLLIALHKREDLIEVKNCLRIE
jgi:cell volume regulation protein A